MNEPWQIRLFKRSLKKRLKLKSLERMLPSIKNGALCFELGCATGTMGYFVRKMGGRWIGADLDMNNLRAARELVGDGVIKINPYGLCFRDGTFDYVVILDFIEHIKDDELCLDEIGRVLKPGGVLIISTPTTGRFFLINRIKNKIGMTPDIYGHVREGYEVDDLKRRLESRGFRLSVATTYSKFFTEAIELAINSGYLFLSGGASQFSKKRDGHISPASQEEMESKRGAFFIYSILFPLVWLISQLDRLLFFLKGYVVMIKAYKSVN